MIRISWMALIVISFYMCRNKSNAPNSVHQNEPFASGAVNVLSADISPCFFLQKEKIASLIGVPAEKITIKEKVLSKHHKSCIALWLLKDFDHKSGKPHAAGEIQYTILFGVHEHDDWASQKVVELMAGDEVESKWLFEELSGTRGYWNKEKNALYWVKNNNVHKLILTLKKIERSRKIAHEIAVDILAKI